MAFVGRHVAFDLGLEFGHVLATGHEVRDLFAGLFSLPEVGRLGAFDEDREVVSDRESVDDIVSDEDDRNALPPRLQDDAKNVRRLLDAERGGRLIGSPSWRRSPCRRCPG